MSPVVPDHYDVYYSDKLWSLLPAVYRAEDTDQYQSKGPLRELVDRIGRQAAILRRDLDRLWENQSIEACDDWAIAYLADLVDTNLVASLDARGQRIDVAKTIYYRRRKGTVSMLEEMAHDITGWDARVVEFFRRLGRTRHGLDPAIGVPLIPHDDIDRLQKAEGLRGAQSRTGIGGFADLRHVQSALQSASAFDEYFHTADVRAPAGRSGWYAIPRLGVFVWRLQSFTVGPATPVPVRSCPGWYTFDPTGRDVPLFAVPRTLSACDAWTSPGPADVAGPISQPLFDASAAAANAAVALYPDVVSVLSPLPPPGEIVPIGRLLVRPEHGRFKVDARASPDPFPAPYWVRYSYGFSSAIGASPADRRIDTIAIAAPAPMYRIAGGGAALAALTLTAGTVRIADSLTYDSIADLHPTAALTVQASNQQRPVLRLSLDWTITGNGNTLALDGLFLCGADLVLAGHFDVVNISCSTLDPGDAALPGGAVASPPDVSPSAFPFAFATDGRPLVPSRIWVEGTVRQMSVDRSIFAAMRTRGEGLVESLTLSNCIVQAIATSNGALTPGTVKDPQRLLRLLVAAEDPVSQRLRSLSAALDAALGSPSSPPPAVASPPDSTVQAVVAALDALVATAPIYEPAAFAHVHLSEPTEQLLRSAGVPSSPPASDLPALNRHLLEDAYPRELADACLAMGDGSVVLRRTTVMGRIAVHRLDASESILQDIATVDDLQQGCVRFSAWADGSTLPRQYESVRIAQTASIFTSERFGDPGFAQLREGADNAIVPGAAASGGVPQNTISAGAQNGSEMGAFAREGNALKEGALLIKLQEFMPAGQAPVLVHVT